MDFDIQPIAKLFWDSDLAALNWAQHRDFIIRRILQYGDLASIRWLRARVPDDDLRQWLISHRGRGLSPQQIRYWALILDIAPGLADEWVKRIAGSIWEKRR